MENKEEADVVITEENDPDADTKLIDDVEVITPENDPEQVTEVKKEQRCNVTSYGDEVIAEGKSILKPDPKTKEKGNRSWFDLK